MLIIFKIKNITTSGQNSKLSLSRCKCLALAQCYSESAVKHFCANITGVRLAQGHAPTFSCWVLLAFLG